MDRHKTTRRNIGDMLQAWGNERFRSLENWVVLRQSLNCLSLVFFWCFEEEKVILASDEVVGEESMRLCKPFVC